MSSSIASLPPVLEHPGSTRLVVARFDRQLLYTALALMGFGLMSVFTASAHQAQVETGTSLSLVLKQFVAMAIGFALMLGISRLHFQFWRKLALPMAGVSILLLLLTMFIGVTANGSERWIALPLGFQFQPSDMAKIAAICLIAQATSLRKGQNLHWFFNIALVGVMILLIYQQPNLSVSMILGFVMFLMLLVSGFPLIVFGLTLPLIVMVLVHKIKHTEYQWRRIIGWLNPWADPLDTGYNLIQSYYAIGSGGILGVGLGHSIQKLYYLPFQHTDFIFSVICEELGFPGALIVIALFALLGWRGFTIAMNCTNPFGRMLAFGLTLAICLQALINICVTVGLMPVTGVTLPLISYGGTSVVMTLMMIGILLNISRHRSVARI